MPRNLSRRQALGVLAGSAAATMLPAGSRAADQAPAAASVSTGSGAIAPARPLKGTLRHSVCRWCYRDVPLPALAAAAREMGLESIELLGPEDWPVVRQHGLICAMANGPTTIPEGINRIETHARVVPAFRERIRAAAEAGIPNVIVFSGNRNGMSDEQGLENCALALEQIVPEAERTGTTVCMELLNSRVNHRDYMCDHTAWGVALVKRVGSERFKLLYDIYHMQIMEGDVIRTIRDHSACIGHYHTAGNPGRHEFTRPDDVQELNYASIMQAIRDTGYRGFIGQEFLPTRDPLTSLREAVALCDV